MLRIIVDSGSSIKQEEREKYGIDILPIRIQIGDKTYLDDVDLEINEFYQMLESSNEFPKTALPSLEDTQKLVEKYTSQGDDVLIITISSEISGTFNTIKVLFDENDKVTVFDSRLAVGGIRLLVEEAIRYKNESIEFIVERLNLLIPKIVVAAIPETLDYLLAGGRLSRASWMVGKILSINPVIGFKDGNVNVLCKKRGVKQGKRYLADIIKEECDESYGIIASYTYNKDNIDELVEMTDEGLRKHITAYDNLTPSIACHWGPNAFGYIYVKK